MYKTSITELIGGTPLLKLAGTNIYAKLEYFNPLHSVKDRAALFMIEGAIRDGKLAAGGTVIEPTSGNTGIGLAYICAVRGYKAVMVMPENMSAERIKLLKHLGAEVILTPKAEGMSGAIAEAKRLNASIPGSFVPNQFANTDNANSHYSTTAPEIFADLGEVVPDYLVLVFGSGGTISGIGKAFKERYPSVKVVAVEPAESPLLSEGRAGAHRIQGIGANVLPELLDRSVIDEVATVTGDEAYAKARYAAVTYGTLVGISSGAALAASLQIAEKHPQANIVTLFPDTGERYLSVF